MTLAQLPCRTCGGEKKVLHNMQYGVEYADWKPCPDCRDADGQPTGLAAWELTEECDCEPGEHERRLKLGWPGCQCSGTGRVLKSGDALLPAVLRLLEREAQYIDVNFTAMGYWEARVVVGDDTPGGYSQHFASAPGLIDAVVAVAIEALEAILIHSPR